MHICFTWEVPQCFADCSSDTVSSGTQLSCPAMLRNTWRFTWSNKERDQVVITYIVIWLPFKWGSGSLSNDETVLNTGRLFPPQFHMTSQVDLLTDKSRSLLLVLMNVKTGLAPTIRAVKMGGCFWGAENDDACLVNTGAQGTVKPRPKTWPSWCLHSWCAAGRALKLKASYDGVKCMEKIL